MATSKIAAIDNTYICAVAAALPKQIAPGTFANYSDRDKSAKALACDVNCISTTAERKPHADCSHCKRRIKPDQPIVWHRHHGQAVPLCLRCHSRAEPKGNHTGRLAGLDQRSCEICARPMYLDGYSWEGISLQSRQPLTCSYQCHHRRKIKLQLERKKVKPATVACVVCGEMFMQARRDAQTCSGACRQKLFRQRRAADRTEVQG